MGTVVVVPSVWYRWSLGGHRECSVPLGTTGTLAQVCPGGVPKSKNQTSRTNVQALLQRGYPQGPPPNHKPKPHVKSFWYSPKPIPIPVPIPISIPIPDPSPAQGLPRAAYPDSPPGHPLWLQYLPLQTYAMQHTCLFLALSLPPSPLLLPPSAAPAIPPPPLFLTLPPSQTDLAT